MTLKVSVGSKNPVKIQAARDGFARMFPDRAAVLTVEGMAAESGVSAQPFSDAETLQGATQRAIHAAALLPDADYAIGIEGGIMPLGNLTTQEADFLAFAWVVVISGGKIGKAKSGAFVLPKEISAHLHAGLELGDADDRVFGQHNSKQHNGSIGLLTDNAITRAELYTPAVIMALIAFKNPQLTWA